MEAAIRVDGVRRSFDVDTAPVRALRGVDLEVGVGEFVALQGASGCGKSTLLNVIAGLDRPDEGTVRVADVDYASCSERDLARVRRAHVGMVFQFFHLLDSMTALENVMVATLIAGERRRPAVGRARGALDLLGLTARADQYPARLSGGERQRLAIARAIVNAPTVLLADEPTGALDSDGGAEITELLGRLHRNGQTILMVTHDERVAAAAGRVVRMSDGRVG